MSEKSKNLFNSHKFTIEPDFFRDYKEDMKKLLKKPHLPIGDGGGGGSKEVNFIIGTINQYTPVSGQYTPVSGKILGKSACTLIATIAAHKILKILDKEKEEINSEIVDQCVQDGIYNYINNEFSGHLYIEDVFDKIESFQSVFLRLENNDFGNLEDNPAGIPILFECNNGILGVINETIGKRTYSDKYTAVVITMRFETSCLFIPPDETKPYFFFNSHPHIELDLSNAFIAVGTQKQICDFYKKVYPVSHEYPDGNRGGNGVGYILQLEIPPSSKRGGSRRKRHQKRKSARKHKSRKTRTRRTKSRRH